MMKRKQMVKSLDDSEFDVLEEIALAMAQAEIENAITDSKLLRADVAERAGKQRSFLTKILRGSHNLTIRTMARIMAACGYELRFGRSPIMVTWEASPTNVSVIPSPGGDAPVDTILFVSSGASLQPGLAA